MILAPEKHTETPWNVERKNKTSLVKILDEATLADKLTQLEKKKLAGRSCNNITLLMSGTIAPTTPWREGRDGVDQVAESQAQDQGGVSSARGNRRGENPEGKREKREREAAVQL
jgi:hypothetical protein